MGYYIETNSANNKAQYLVDSLGGTLISRPTSFNNVPSDKGLVVVVNNGPFEAAGYIFNEREFIDFTAPYDNRPKQYVLLDKTVAEKESGYKK